MASHCFRVVAEDNAPLLMVLWIPEIFLPCSACQFFFLHLKIRERALFKKGGYLPGIVETSLTDPGALSGGSFPFHARSQNTWPEGKKRTLRGAYGINPAPCALPFVHDAVAVGFFPQAWPFPSSGNKYSLEISWLEVHYTRRRRNVLFADPYRAGFSTTASAASKARKM